MSCFYFPRACLLACWTLYFDPSRLSKFSPQWVLTLSHPTAIVLIMKNIQHILSNNFCRLALLAMVVGAPQIANAAYPVTDAGVIAQLVTLNATASRIEGHAASINRSSATTAQNTTQIMKDTAQINQTTLATLPKIQQDIQTMREIGEARQKLTLEITKLSELVNKGNVLKSDAFAKAVADKNVSSSVSGGDSITKILQEMGGYMKTPWDLTGDPGLDSVTQDQMATNSFSAGSDLTFRFQDEEGGVQQDTLLVPSEAGISEVRAKLESLFGRSWNGYGFVGKNAGYMQAMVGHGGRLLGFDYVPPVGNIALSETQRGRLKDLGTSSLNDVLKNHLRQNYRRVTQSGGNPWEIIPGVYVRPRTEADALFEKMVLSPDATPGSEAAFYAAASSYSKTQYDPFWGFSENAELQLPVNVNEVLTRGAYTSVQEYLEEKGSDATQNPYGNFGKSIAPVLASLVDNTPPGTNLLITASDLEKAEQTQGLSLKGTPTTPKEWREMFARSEATEAEYIRAAASGATTPAVQPTILFGLNTRDTKTYNSKIIANSTRLSQNNKTLLTQVCLLNYNQESLAAVIKLEEALARLSASATAQNVVEMLPMMRDNAQNTIMVLQNRIGQIQAQVDTLLKEKHEALADRQKIVEDYQGIIIENSKPAVERLMMLTAPTSLPM